MALDRDREQDSCIQTIPGRGYRFVGEVRIVPDPDFLTEERIDTIIEQLRQPVPAGNTPAVATGETPKRKTSAPRRAPSES